MTVTLETEFSETGQSEPWKNDVAKELNIVLVHARAIHMAIGARDALISLVQRVADFEEIFVLKGEE